MSRRAAWVALFISLPAASAAKERDLAGELRTLFAQQREQLHIAGLSYAVVSGGEVVAIDAIGERDVERKLPVTIDTVFPIGSCTKAFTALAVGIAHDEERLSLDDSPRKYLPWFRMQDPEANELVTLRDMLSHRTGLKAYADLASLGGVLDREQFLRATISAKPVAKLRETFQYSNPMITAAGEVAARVYRSTWEQVIETKLLRPMGMTSSLTSAYDAAKAADGAIGYEYDGTTWKETPVTDTLQVMAPAGAIASSARDMTRYLRMLIDGGALDGKQIISAATLGEATRAHTRMTPSMSYALGWVIYEWNGGRVVEHNGGSAGLSAIISFMPERRAGYVVLANSPPTALTKVGAFAQSLYPLLFGANESGSKPAPPPRTTAIAAPPAGTSEVPPLDQLLARMIAAAGGERAQLRHQTKRSRATMRYEHQGVRSEVTVIEKAPARRIEDETLFAGTKRIGRVRIWFDSTRGAQQTTFEQDSTLAGEELEAAKRDYRMHPLLELRALYATVAVERVAVLDGEDAFVLLLTPASGAPVRLYVSARTALVVRRDTGTQSTRYRDFRNVDGEVVPFSITVDGALGEQTITVHSVEFGVAAPDASFAPIAKL